MRVRYTDTALDETDDILKHIANDNPAAAASVAAAIKAAIGRLGTFPQIGAVTDEPGIYLKIARPYRYLIFYRIDGDIVVIRNVRHPARRRPPSPLR
jgi:plasmid stabilization system protein ParE